MTSVAIAAFFLWLAGLVKGAIGAGAPVIAVPPLVLLYDVRTAVIVMLAQNLIVNIWQWWKYRSEMLDWRFTSRFAIASALGAGVGSYLLVYLSAELLELSVAVGVLLYIAFRLMNPKWVLTLTRATPLAAPMGLAAGIMQGASGISAPITIGFMNALKLGREAFIATISVYFIAMTIVQLPVLLALGALTPQLVGWSLLALIPIAVGLPVGQWLIRYTSRETFDRLILVFLAILALRLLWNAL